MHASPKTFYVFKACLFLTFKVKKVYKALNLAKSPSKQTKLFNTSLLYNTTLHELTQNYIIISRPKVKTYNLSYRLTPLAYYCVEVQLYSIKCQKLL